MTETSVWTYPWDLHDVGVDNVLDMFARQGVNMISLATSYHAGKFLQPGNPRRRVYFPQDGVVYYQVDPDRWTEAEIKPLEADAVSTEGDYLKELIRRRDAGGPIVSCWTVCLHNTRLGMAHPNHVMRTAHGNPLYFGLCPSSPAARAYVVGLVAEISDRFRPSRIELESPDFMAFNHGYHHEKDSLGLMPEDQFLLGLCFCQHCMAGATKANVNAEAARDRVRSLLDQAFTQELPRVRFPGFPKSGLDAFVELPELMSFLRWRSAPVTSLIAEIRAEAHQDSQILLIDDNDSWWRGVDLRAAVQNCDGVIHCAYSTPKDRIIADLSRTRSFIGSDKTLIAGFQLNHPEVSDSADFTARVGAAGKVADGCNFYNFGLVPNPRLDWLGIARSEPTGDL